MKKLLFLVGFLVLLAFPVKAGAYYCTGEAFDLAEKDAYGVKITHELKFVEGNWEEPYYDLTITNMTKNIQVVYDGSIYTYGMDKNYPDSYTVYGGSQTDVTVSFAVYPIVGSPCTGHKVHTINHKLPYYNIFANSDECIAYPGFPLCDKNYRGDADLESFLVELEKYKAELAKKPTEPEAEEKKTGIIGNIINFYMNNKIITIPLTIILLSGIVVLANRHMQKKKKRAKYKIKI